MVSRMARPVLEPGAQHHCTAVCSTERFLLWAASAVLQISVLMKVITLRGAQHLPCVTQRRGVGCPGCDED